jgi:hypothetical protein
MPRVKALKSGLTRLTKHYIKLKIVAGIDACWLKRLTRTAINNVKVIMGLGCFLIYAR